MSAGVGTSPGLALRTPAVFARWLAAWRSIEREQVVGAALLGVAALAPLMIQLAVGRFPVRVAEVVRLIINYELWSFTLLLCVVVAEARVDRGGGRLIAYGGAVVIAAIVGVLLGLANSHFVFDALRNPPEPLRAKAMVVTLLQYSVPIYSVLEFSLIGSLATYLYVDHRDARRMAQRLHEAGLRRTDQARQMLEAQLQTMQARVEPRFLFNTLAQVQDLHRADPTAAVAMLDRLIDYLRAAMPRMRDTSSTVAQETDLVRAYLEIVKLRLGHRLGFTIDVPAEAGSARMPPMMMLPLADHAIVYGLERRQGGGTIAISVDVAAGRLRLMVVDRGAGFVPETQGDGIASIRERLAALYGDAASLDLRRGDVDGTAAILEIPYETGRDEAAP